MLYLDIQCGTYFLFLCLELCLYQGLSKHQEGCFTPVIKVKTFNVIFRDLLGAIENVDPER